MLDALHYRTVGAESNPPVLVLHGWGSSAELMMPLCEGLADNFRAYVVDLPGHGQSPPPPEPWGIEEHVELVRAFIRERIHSEEDASPVPIIGHSNGGRIALFLSSLPDASKWVDSLVLISPSGIPRRPSLVVRLKRMVARVLKAPLPLIPKPLRGPAEDWLRHSLLWRALGSSDYKKLQGVMRETFVRTVNSFVDDRLSQIHVPVVIFWGTADEAISEEQVCRLEEGIADAGLIRLEGSGHYGYLDDPNTVIAATQHFLQRCLQVQRSTVPPA